MAKALFSAILLFFSSIIVAHQPAVPGATLTVPFTCESGPNANHNQVGPASATGFRWVPVAIICDGRFTEKGNSISFLGVPFHGADRSSFAVAAYTSNTRTIYTRYAKDLERVYFFPGIEFVDPANSTAEYQPIPGADPATFAPVFGSWTAVAPDVPLYATDQRSAYYDGAAVAGADPSSFTPILNDEEETDYATDTQHVYYKARPIPGADPNSFRYLLGGRYLIDRHAVYSIFKQDGTISPIPVVVDGADPATFHTIDPAASLCGTRPVPGLFCVVLDGADKNHKYYSGRIVN